MANELVVFEEKDLVLPSEVSDVLAANLGEDAEITALNLPRVTLSSGSTRLEIPTGTGKSDLVDSVTIWPANVSPKVRRFYRTPYDATQTAPPDCSSVGGKRGHGDPGGLCKPCPYNQWGSARQGDGKACSEYKYMFAMVPGLFLPIVIAAPPTSQGSLRDFLMDCVIGNNRYWHTLVEVSLRPGNTPAPVLQFEIEEVLPEEAHAELDRAHTYIEETFPIQSVEDVPEDVIDGTAQPVEEEPVEV